MATSVQSNSSEVSVGLRRAAMLVILSAVWLLTVATLFSTEDIRRPLVISEEDYPVAHGRRFDWAKIRPLVTGDVQQKDVEASLALTGQALNYFTINKYDDKKVFLCLQYLTEAVNRFPGNAFAWNELGAYLALMNQMPAAIEATEKSLALLRPLSPEDAQRLRPLFVVGLLNLADFRISEGEYDRALLALDELGDAAQLDSFWRLAYYWRKAQALSALGEPEAARAALDHASQISSLEDSRAKGSLAYDYPQYFEKKKRDANTSYISALIALDEGDFEAAIKTLQSAAEEGGKSWENSFLLANARFEKGDLNGAAGEFRELKKKMGDGKVLFGSERVSFNLGNTYLAQRNFPESIKAYEDAIKLVRARSRTFRERIADPLERYDAQGLVAKMLAPDLAADAEIYSAAYNNLGNAYFEYGTATGNKALIAKAEHAYRDALTNPRYEARYGYVARTNLGHLYWQQGEHDRALNEMTLALSRKPNHQEGLDRLYQMASSTQDLELAAKAYSILLDSLERTGPRAYLVERFGDWFRAIRTGLDQPAAGPVARQVRDRVIRLLDDSPGAAGASPGA